MSANQRLDRAFNNALRLPLHRGSRYVLFSDCHRGTGTSNDNFLTNQHIYLAALKYYYEHQYTYLELGDGDELWENRKIEPILDIYSNIFELFQCFHRQNRIYLLYGNHDIVKKYPPYCKKHFSSYYCLEKQCKQPLFTDFHFHESLILENTDSPANSIYLTHGHQVSLLNSVFWPLARFLVRYFWLPLERIGFNDPTSAATNYSVKKHAEGCLSNWASLNNYILITGHTHRPILHADHPAYFNTGSCVHPHTITCIELQGKTLSLVKWFMSTRASQSVFINRELMAGPFEIENET